MPIVLLVSFVLPLIFGLLFVFLTVVPVLMGTLLLLILLSVFLLMRIPLMMRSGHVTFIRFRLIVSCLITAPLVASNGCSNRWSSGAPNSPSFPCGKCPYCRTRRSNDWIVRLESELKDHVHALFVTFTYQDGECDRTPSNFLTLNPRHLELFWKQLRTDYFRAHGENAVIKYYACGEYGSRTFRPHYHAIIFGATPDMVENAWRSSDGVMRGFVHFGTVTSDSIAYCTKYIMKPARIPLFVGDDRVPEFQRTSTNLGIGYLSLAMLRWHRADKSRFYVVKATGHKVALPRYYRDRIYLPSSLEARRELLIPIIKAERLASDRDAHIAAYGDDLSFIHCMRERALRNARVAFAHSLSKRVKL